MVLAHCCDDRSLSDIHRLPRLPDRLQQHLESCRARARCWGYGGHSVGVWVHTEHGPVVDGEQLGFPTGGHLRPLPVIKLVRPFQRRLFALDTQDTERTKSVEYRFHDCLGACHPVKSRVHGSHALDVPEDTYCQSKGRDAPLPFKFGHGNPVTGR